MSVSVSVSMPVSVSMSVSVWRSCIGQACHRTRGVTFLVISDRPQHLHHGSPEHRWQTALIVSTIVGHPDPSGPRSGAVLLGSPARSGLSSSNAHSLLWRGEFTFMLHISACGQTSSALDIATWVSLNPVLRLTVRVTDQKRPRTSVDRISHHPRVWSFQNTPADVRRPIGGDGRESNPPDGDRPSQPL
jgi:hypothetical protein